MLGLQPGINDRWHAQRPPIGPLGDITVDAAAFRLDAGIAPPRGQGTNTASRLWVRRIGGRQSDQAGHVIARRFGGSRIFNGPDGNLFPQNPTVNMGYMNVFDGIAAEKHREGCDVCVHIALDYGSPSDMRPHTVLYTYLYRSVGATRFNPPIGPVQLPNP
ncbi:MAG: DNA/RNA non-specific endonuclease [Burkholderiales bacterium]|nr:DNA/RNA non-specific endonuclease [Burkholderiales bacterium]